MLGKKMAAIFLPNIFLPQMFMLSKRRIDAREHADSLPYSGTGEFPTHPPAIHGVRRVDAERDTD